MFAERSPLELEMGIRTYDILPGRKLLLGCPSAISGTSQGVN